MNTVAKNKLNVLNIPACYSIKRIGRSPVLRPVPVCCRSFPFQPQHAVSVAAHCRTWAGPPPKCTSSCPSPPGRPGAGRCTRS